MGADARGVRAGNVRDSWRPVTDVVADTVGRVESAVKSMKSGVKLALRDAALRSRRLQVAVGGSVADLQEAMETEFYDFLVRLAEGDGEPAETLVGEMLLDSQPEDPQLDGSRRVPTDEWRFGHVGGWVCLDHYVERSRFYAPRQGSQLPRALPVDAFTGGRLTRILDPHGVLVEEVLDDWRHAADRDDRELWVGPGYRSHPRLWRSPTLPSCWRRCRLAWSCCSGGIVKYAREFMSCQVGWRFTCIRRRRLTLESCRGMRRFRSVPSWEVRMGGIALRTACYGAIGPAIDYGINYCGYPGGVLPAGEPLRPSSSWT